MIEYGKCDADTAAYKLLLQEIKDRDVKYIMHFPRMPFNARPCKLPGSLYVKAVLASNEVVTVKQSGIGTLPYRV